LPLQLPQSAVRLVPQLSAAVTESQLRPRRAQKAVSVSGLQPHTFRVPAPPHDSGAVQVPQSAVRVAPQLSPAVRLPHVAPARAQNAASVSAAQPQEFAVPPPPQV
jgi:hypothetical protein